MTTDQIEKIKSIMERENMTATELAKTIGASHNTIHQLLHGGNASWFTRLVLEIATTSKGMATVRRAAAKITAQKKFN